MDRFGRGEIDVDDMAALEWDLERNAPVTELEIDRENEGLLLRQRNYRRAAETVAVAVGQHPAVRLVVLFGSVARPLKKEMPRFSRFRRARAKCVASSPPRPTGWFSSVAAACHTMRLTCI